MKKIVIILSIFAFITDVFSQNIGIAEKDAINNMVLYKAFTKYTQATGRELTSVDPKYVDGESCYYFDSDEHLRKIISWSEYPESSGVIIAYYDKEGELMYILFSDFQPEGYSYQGLAYKTHRDYDWGDSIKFQYNLQYNMLSDFENISVYGNSSKYPAITPEWNVLSKYTHVDSLALIYGIETFRQPANCKKVQFSKPVKNQIAFTNSHNINLREQPNTSSRIVRTMDIGLIVKILEVLPEETVRNVGTYNWYKIEVFQRTGYVFGAFLETVEQEIE